MIYLAQKIEPSMLRDLLQQVVSFTDKLIWALHVFKVISWGVLNLTLMLKTNCCSGVIQGDTLPHRCSLATLYTHGKVPIIVTFFMGMLLSAEVFVGKVALSYVP